MRGGRGEGYAGGEVAAEVQNWQIRQVNRDGEGRVWRREGVHGTRGSERRE